MSQTADTIAALITEGAALDAEIAKKSDRLRDVKTQLLSALPSGEHEGNDGAKCKVITPSAAVKPSDEDADAVREIAGDDAFKKLFERVTSWKPVKAFRAVLGAITEKRIANKVLALVEKESTPYVKFS